MPNPNVNVSISGLDKLVRIAKKVAEQKARTDGDLAKWIKKAAFTIEAKSKIAVKTMYSKPPIDTGRMWSSIRVNSLTSKMARVGPNVHYAHQVHEGKGTSSKYGRRPFMEDGAKLAEKELQQTGDEIAKNIRLAIESVR